MDNYGIYELFHRGVITISNVVKSFQNFLNATRFPQICLFHTTKDGFHFIDTNFILFRLRYEANC